MPEGCLKAPKPLVICSLTHVLACIWYGLGCVSCVRDPLFGQLHALHRAVQSRPSSTLLVIIRPRDRQSFLLSRGAVSIPLWQCQ